MLMTTPEIQTKATELGPSLLWAGCGLVMFLAGLFGTNLILQSVLGPQ